MTLCSSKTAKGPFGFTATIRWKREERRGGEKHGHPNAVRKREHKKTKERKLWLFVLLSPQTEWFKSSLLTVKEQTQMKGTNTSLLISVLRRNRPNGGINCAGDCKKSFIDATFYILF